MVFCQTSKAWKDTVMDVLCLNIETWAWVRRVCTASETHCLLELGDKGGISFLFFFFPPSAIDFLIWYILLLYSHSWCLGIDVLSQISCSKYHVKLEWIYLYQKTMLLSERWTLKHWDRTECVLCPFPALLFTGKVQESATCHRRVVPTCCPACTNCQNWTKETVVKAKFTDVFDSVIFSRTVCSSYRFSLGPKPGTWAIVLTNREK